MFTIALFILVVGALYLYGKKNYKYWEKKGVKHDPPIAFFGNYKESFLMQKSITQVATELYWKYPTEKVLGSYRATSPELIIRDPEIIKKVLVSDFSHFYPRGIISKKLTPEPLQRNLFSLDGDTWRLLRQRITPAFTSGKLKAMYPLIVERAERLQALALTAAEAKKPIDARDLMARYTTDFIGACGFGLDSDSLRDENSAFRKLGASFLQRTTSEKVIMILKQLFPNIFKNFKMSDKIEAQIKHLLSQVLRERNYAPSGRNDFIDLLLEFKNKGTIVGDSIERKKSDGITPEVATLDIDDDLIAAQVFVFFVAGFETSSSSTSYTLHELAYNPEIQTKVQQEIDSVLAKYDNKLSYDAVKEMKYLEWTFKEGMRLFPILGFLMRECARKYTFEELNLTIEEGVKVLIPVQALHKDPNYFENPEEFRPERFDPQNFDKNNKYVYLPFGEGPRACIGERLGLMQSLAGLAALLSKFTVRPAPTSLRHPPVNPVGGLQTVKDGLPLLFIERKATQ